MKRNWSEDELSASWLLLPSDLELLVNKHWETHLGFGVLLKFFQQEGRFPDSVREIPKSVIEFIANQVHSPTKNWRAYSWDGATIKRHRKEIREWFGFRESTLTDHDELKTWLRKEIIPQGYREEKLRELLFQKCRLLHIEPPTSTHIQRLIQAANQQHEDLFCESIFNKLNETTLRRMSNLLQQCPSDEEGIEKTRWQIIKEEPGRAGLESVKAASMRLSMVREVELPLDLFKNITPKLLDRYAKRAVVEEPYELRRHTEQLKATLMAAYLFKRKEDLTDHLIDLLVETVHKMGKKAERQIDAGIGEELQKAPRKMVRLYRMAKASVQAPKGLVEDVIFPEAPEQWLNSFIKEVEAKSSYKNNIVPKIESLPDLSRDTLAFFKLLIRYRLESVDSVEFNIRSNIDYQPLNRCASCMSSEESSFIKTKLEMKTWGNKRIEDNEDPVFDITINICDKCAKSLDVDSIVQLTHSYGRPEAESNTLIFYNVVYGFFFGKLNGFFDIKIYDQFKEIRVNNDSNKG